MKRHALLDDLVQRGAVWRGRSAGAARGRSLPTGWAGLDRRIGGGWPRGALTELLTARGCGLGLLVPALVALRREAGWLAWVSPPLLPYAPALRARGVSLAHSLLVRAPAEQQLWVTEQALRSGVCSVVLSWPASVTVPQLRRLQLAAEAGGGLGLVFRPPEAAAQASPAALRLQLQPDGGALRVRVVKRPGGWGGGELRLVI
jgi:hypothetical protein